MHVKKVRTCYLAKLVFRFLQVVLQRNDQPELCFYFSTFISARKIKYFENKPCIRDFVLNSVLNQYFFQGWLLIRRIPTCIFMRGKSYDFDMLRTTTYNFQLCVPRITYCHSHQRFKFFYYEWYIPKDYNGGMDWDIYFFGPESLKWG